MNKFTPIVTVLDEEGKRRLGQLVKELRGGLTQKEFAERLEVSQSTLSMWEAGKVTPDLENLEKLADVWGKTPEEFVAFLYGRMFSQDSLDNIIRSMPLEDLAKIILLASTEMVTKTEKRTNK